MLCAVATRFDRDDPASAVEVMEREPRPLRDGWSRVKVKAASVNHHDLVLISGGVAPKERLPIVLGSDAAGTDEDGNDVIVHSLITGLHGGTASELLDPKRTLLSDWADGTFAETVMVPSRNVLPMPPSMTYQEAACLPTAWLTAYRMLFAAARVRPGDTVLIQGSGGGVATAAIMLSVAAGLTVWVTGREPKKRTHALQIGAHGAFEPGARLPSKVDAVIETVGEATWGHSLRSVRPGGTVVVSGWASGSQPRIDLAALAINHVTVAGSSMGTRDDLRSLIRLCESRSIRPPIDSTFELSRASEAIARIASGDAIGKVVITM